MQHVIHAGHWLFEDGLIDSSKTGDDQIALSYEANQRSVYSVVGIFADFLDRSSGNNKSFVLSSSINTQGAFSAPIMTSNAAAVEGFALSMLPELGAKNIRINVLRRGTIVGASAGDKSFEHRAAGAPLGRLVAPDEVGLGYVYLIHASGVNGQVHTVDAGQGKCPFGSVHQQYREGIRPSIPLYEAMPARTLTEKRQQFFSSLAL